MNVWGRFKSDGGLRHAAPTPWRRHSSGDNTKLYHSNVSLSSTGARCHDITAVAAGTARKDCGGGSLTDRAMLCLIEHVSGRAKGRENERRGSR